MVRERERLLAGRYRLAEMLGQGGMGIVWRAEDRLLHRSVAIKEVVPPKHLVDHDRQILVDRTIREARAAARLSHRGIVTVHDVVAEDGRPWIVMELVAGRTLEQMIRQNGPLGEEWAARIGLDVLHALVAAHQAGVLHRDVKPANIMLAGDRVVLTDFGIAALADDTALTAASQLVGSPAYLAPERIEGGPATEASDLWAFGATLYTLVTGRSPFQRDGVAAVLHAVLTGEPAPPPGADRIWRVIKGLLRKDPGRRLTASAAISGLTEIIAPVPRPPRRTRGKTALAAGAAVAVAAATALVTWRVVEARAPVETTSSPTAVAVVSQPPSPTRTKASPSASPAETTSAVPSGFTRYRHRSGFSLAVPRDWRLEDDAKGAVWGGGTADALGGPQWQLQAKVLPGTDRLTVQQMLRIFRDDLRGQRDIHDYEQLRFETVPGTGAGGVRIAETEARFRPTGSAKSKWRTYVRFVAGPKRGAALIFSTPENEWDAAQLHLRIFVESFRL